MNNWIAACIAAALTLVLILVRKSKFWNFFFSGMFGLFSFLVMVDIIPTDSSSKNEHFMTLARTNFNEGKYSPADSLYQKVSVSTQKYIQPEIKRNKECCDLTVEIDKDLDNGNFDQAKDKLIIIVRLNPQDQNIRQQIEYCDSMIVQKKENKNNNLSEKPTQTVIKNNKQEAMTYNSKGLRYSAMGDNDKAIENYSRAIKLYPDYYQAYRNRSIQYENIDKYDLAFEDADKAVKIKSSGPNYEQRGDINCILRKYSAATEDYIKAIDCYSKINSTEWYDGKKVTYQSTDEIIIRIREKQKYSEKQNALVMSGLNYK
jgi:Tfp pilus assembly protein PilF